MTWVLIILVSVGPSSKYEANGVSSVSGFASKEQCEKAASATRLAFSPGSKEARTVCVEQGKAP